ncbi:non-ribosomal peptide synthetase/type I polyketide synthase [Methylovirgula sp. 4M-Z18]|uniref:non-ribosomal peptide synthetase/type I polyketide synthase n=1 Tax=Methylovirgula sp. 4M-Z18 TaxID=2293567 RepID=UPI000E2F8D37|nr:non-ribosomal peptide synthetase/type I polyketide synthase [Methylovirgula sp. 4M-Z18]RFB75519.1 amino acid adenylation domain-containing protein [Methylovirgula sp. 4M-Z18]
MSDNGGGIAIIGLAGRFPGAQDTDAFWRNLCDGVESIRHFRDDEMEDSFAPEIRAHKNFVKARPILDGVDMFDAGFFGMQAREADITDPQQRVFLECCWQALEDGGYDPAQVREAIGVTAGCSINTYFLHHVLRDRKASEQFTSDYQVGSYPALIGNGQDFVATRVAYKLNLRGPAMTVQSACSTSLLAVAQACQSLMLYQADMMLAGGVSISFPQKRGFLYQDGGMVSPDGRCRPFDAGANGTVFGAGCGVVLLKRLDDALASGDHIYAVIRGFGVTNDGAGKVGYTAPSVDGQAEAIVAAHAMADVDPHAIRYVECHGTATPLGDPIEFSGLLKAFGETDAQRGQYCALGSVKGNVGHLDIAAGVTGLIKTALSIRHGKIPPTLHFKAPNPAIALDRSPFYVAAQPVDWHEAEEDRVAGVSAFGVGGTNVHVVVAGTPQTPSEPAALPRQVLVLSARSEAALNAARAQLARHLGNTPGENLADMAHTLQAGRRAFPYRCALNAATAEEAMAKLRAPLAQARAAASEPPPVVFMFPGQGSQYIGMGRALYTHVRAFRDAIDRCAAILQPILKEDLRALLYPESAAAEQHMLTQTRLAQPAIFAVEYALAQVWLAWGIRPAAMIGHSVGEFVAACLADVMSLEDALNLVAARGQLMQDLPPGAMLAVRLSEADLTPLLPPDVSLAAINGPAFCVAAGPFDAIEALEKQLDARGTGYRRLHTSHAFHSAMVEPTVAPLSKLARSISLRAPTLPYVSCVTGDWITAAEATSAEYWGRHSREAVRFAAGLETLLKGGAAVLLEAGPGMALTTFARTIAAKHANIAIAGSLPTAEQDGDALATMLDALGQLWCAGVQPDWQAVHGPAQRRRVSLPTYPFERARHWIDAPTPQAGPAPAPVNLEERMLTSPQAAAMPADGRATALQAKIVALLEELSGESIAEADPHSSFLELGFDSLLLGQFVQQMQTRLGVDVSFRQLLSDLPSIAALTDYAAQQLPAEAAPQPVVAPALQMPVAPIAAQAAPASGSMIERLMQEQLRTMQQLMQQQLDALRSAQTMQPEAKAVVASAPAPAATLPPPPVAEAPSRFQVYRAGANTAKGDTTVAQRAHIDALIARTVARTPTSKKMTQDYRAVLADPRAAAGFRAEWKEMVYPIVSDKAQGAHIVDVDGNEYIDLVNGYGQTAFGHRLETVVDAVAAQLQRGFAIGPQTPLAGEAATLMSELTGCERVTFCNTGSEAVMAALRLARTVTGRNRVVSFGGAYHGQFDEVLVKAGRNSANGLPAAPGIPRESVSNVTVLPYGTPESLEWIRANAQELAAVIVEPVQSRHPGLQPKGFLQALREITTGSGSALIFDEVVTGFRMHPAGMQAVFGISADMATYGKVVGGGMPVGILTGKKRFMDALDGGMWRYGDDSYPEVAPTFFAGTFVRHPLVMAAVCAVLRHLKAEGPELQQALTTRTVALVARLNADFERRGIAARIETCGSLFYFSLAHEDRLASLLYYHLRLRGIYIQEGFPCFLTTAHSDADYEAIATAFAESLDELQSVGILAPAAQQSLDVPLTEPQSEIWLSAQMGDEASCAFNESVTLRLRGALDTAMLTQALQEIVQRHDALRLQFDAGGEMAHVNAQARLNVATLQGDERALAALTDQEARTPFDLVSDMPIRAHLVTLAPDDHALVLTAHHIVCDGWSVNVILQELGTIYAAHRAQRAHGLPAPLAFSTFAHRQHERPAAALASQEAYWLQQFATPAAPLDLPTDRPRGPRRTFSGATYSRMIGAENYQTIKKAGARNGCTLFATLLAGFQALMGRLASSKDVVVGIPTAGQSLLKDETLVGHCVNFLPVRSTWSADTSLADLLKATRQRVLDAYEHQDYTLGTLVRKLAPAREANRLPLTDLQFNLERLAEPLQTPDLALDITPNAKAFVTHDMFLNIIESPAGLRLDCDYNTDLFDRQTIARWLDWYEHLLLAIAADARCPVVQANYLPDAERAALLGSLNDTAQNYPKETCLPALISARAAEHPNKVAIVCGGTRMTYGELGRRSDALAAALQANGVAPKHLVCVLMERSVDLVVALLGVMKAGCAYIPLDPKYPAERLRQIVGDASARGLIVNGTLGSSFNADDMIVIDMAQMPVSGALAQVAVTAEDLAYVIYTSGSTGTPKGVEISHRALVNLLSSMAREPGCGAEDVLFAVTTISFDIAGLELFLPMMVGGTLVVATNEDLADGVHLPQRVTEVGATMMQATPSLWQVMLESGFTAPQGFKMLCGGEALNPDLARRLLAGQGELWNMYGPTETTIWSSCARITDADAPISVGRPITNTSFYVLDKHDQPVAPGAVGQLHIGGDGVARGYVNRPELTAEKFIANPFGPGRLYRTGDVARWLPNGEMQILGRIDAQIKLRGFRIEPGEIESTLLHHGGLDAAVVQVHRDEAGQARLVCYYVEQSGVTVPTVSLEAAARKTLPDYMIPQVWVRLARLPLLPNGKLDRGQLPAPDLAVPAPAAATFAAPVTPTQTALAGIWADVLQLPKIGIDQDLFDLGADSIHLFKITARARKLGIRLTARELIQHRTIAALAEHLGDGEKRA